MSDQEEAEKSEKDQKQEYTEKELKEKPYLTSPLLLHDLSFNEAKGLRFDPSDKFLAVASGNSETHVLDVNNNFELIKTFKTHSHSMVLPAPLAWLEDGTRLLISAPNNTMQIINSSTWEPVHSEDISLDSQHHKGAPVCCAAFRPSVSKKHEFACGDTNKNIKIVSGLETEKPKLIHDLQHHSHWVLCLKFNRRGDRLVSGSVDQHIFESDAENEYVKLREVVKIPNWVCNFSDLFPDGDRIAVGSWERKTRIVNLKEGKIVNEHNAGVTGSTYDVCISHHSKNSRREPFIVTGSGGGAIAFSNVKGEKVREVINVGKDVYSVTCSHNNKFLAAGTTGHSLVILKQPLHVFVAEDRMPAFKLRMLSKGKISEACEIYNVTVLIALYLA